jgi:peptidoglycan/LPS O-acetylase OafA/YrhL
MGILRFILAIAVVIAHSSPIFGYTFVGGMVAVQTFYIISGFYMSLILNEKYLGKGSYKLFLSNRLLRLYPIYWIIIGLIILFSIMVAIITGGNNLGPISGYGINDYFARIKSMHISTLIFMVFTNLFMFFQDIVMFLKINMATGMLAFTKNFYETEQPLYHFLLVPQAWTMGVELMFYVIAPFLFRRNKKVIYTLVFFSIALRILLIYKFDLKNDPWNYRFFPTELVFFLLGNISYSIYKRMGGGGVISIYKNYCLQ